MIVERAVGGMLLVGTAEAAILEMFARHVPQIVLLDNRDETGNYESVLSDGFGGAYAAVTYLLELGHRRIGFFVTEPQVTTFTDRLRGYRSALFESGITPDKSLLASGQSEFESEKALVQMLHSPLRPTALICVNDKHALDAVRVCRELELKIPEDLSLIGFDDVPFAAHMHPQLTTVRVNKEFMGRLAVRRLHERMQHALTNKCPEPAVSVHVPVSLIFRASCISPRVSG